MATIGSVSAWPYEYKGWRITYYMRVRDPNVTRRTLQKPDSIKEEPPLVEHLHADSQQLVRWTHRRKPVKLTRPIKITPEITEKFDPTAEEQLCCFVCAEYMPKKVYEYFERCREITKCAMLE